MLSSETRNYTYLYAIIIVDRESLDVPPAATLYAAARLPFGKDSGCCSSHRVIVVAVVVVGWLDFLLIF